MKDGWWTKPGGLVLISIAVASVWALTFFVRPFFGLNWTEAGQSGDMFGAVNALFSGLAFAGLIFTIAFQRRENEEQRRIQQMELEEQRRELELQRQDSDRSRRELNLQRFENTLFGLLRNFNEHVNSIQINRIVGPSDSKVLEVVRGRAAIRELMSKLPNQVYQDRHFYTSLDSSPPEIKRRSLNDQWDLYHKYFYEDLEPDFALYMRLLYGIFRHIDVSILDDNQKKMYSRIVRANLSSSEVKFIMFDCSGGVGLDFKEWVERYGLLKHSTMEDRRNNPDLVQKYDLAAFEPVPIPHKVVG